MATLAKHIDLTPPIPVPTLALPTNGVETSAANGVLTDLESLPIIASDMPVMFEDEGQENMGDERTHSDTGVLLFRNLIDHLAKQPGCEGYEVLFNLSLYYHRIQRKAHVSPDVMVLKPFQPLPKKLPSYRIRVNGPAPELAIEVLSPRTYQQGDLTIKPIIYRKMGVMEYIVVDGTGEFLKQKLRLYRRQKNGRWKKEQDADGGVTSRFGFRIIIGEDDIPYVIETGTGKRYVRPEKSQIVIKKEAEARRKAENEARKEAEARKEEAEARRKAENDAKKEAAARRKAENNAKKEAAARTKEAAARRKAEEQTKALQAELDRLRGTQPA